MQMDLLTSVIAKRCENVDLVVVAMSGGVDSSLVAAAAYRVLGRKCIAVTVKSELTAGRDFTRAVEAAEHIGIEHHPLNMFLLKDPQVRRNTETRCYHCKRAVFELMVLEYGDDTLIMDGTNGDDDPARPGLKAVQEFGVFSPLREAGLTKSAVRETAREIGLTNWNAPSESCLATRIPIGIPLNKERLDMVQTMESFFHERGVETLRARHDNLVATVEHLPQYADIMVKHRDSFAALIKRIGLRSFIFREWSQ